MAQLSEQGRALWTAQINRYVKTLNSPEHVKAVQEFVEAFGSEGIVSQRGQNALSGIIDSLSRIFGVKISQIVVGNSNSMNGGYTFQNKSLFFNAGIKGVAEFLMTIYHEMRHAFQFQVMMYQKDEFGMALKQGASTYRVFDGTLKGNTDYYTNLLEEDAVMYSIAAADEVIAHLPIPVDLRNKYYRELDRLQLLKLQKIYQYENAKKTSIENTKSYIKEYGDVLLTIFKTHGTPEEKKQAISKGMKELEGKYAPIEETLRKDKSFVIETLRYVFDNCTLEELTANIDDPNVSLLISMENMYGVKNGSNYASSVLKATYYGSHFEKIRDFVHTSKDMLDAYKVPYDKNDSGKMFTTFLDSAKDLNAGALERIAKNQPQPEDKKLISFINTLNVFGLGDRAELKRRIVEKYGLRKIRAWYSRIYSSEKAKGGKNYASMYGISLMGYRLSDFENEGQQMQSPEFPKKSVWRNIFGTKVAALGKEASL